jgi:hypothetical protein
MTKEQQTKEAMPQIFFINAQTMSDKTTSNTSKGLNDSEAPNSAMPQNFIHKRTNNKVR